MRLFNRTKKQNKPAPADRPGFSFGRHIAPPLIGVTMMVAVLGFFNSQFIAAKIAAATFKPTAVQSIPESNTKADPSQPPKIIIESIGVNAPVVLDVPQAVETQFQLALRKGVVHYPSTAVPGQVGNVVLFGHSSGQVWAPGDYKFVFTRLEKLKPGDRIILEYQGIRYFYKINGSKVVQPNEVSVLRQPTDINMLTLITCTPVGTDKNRLIVTAEQIAPRPINQTQTAPQQISEIDNLPDGESASFWDSLTSLF